MKLLSSDICPFVQRVAALLETKQIHYEVEKIDLRNKPDWFLNISPRGQVPVLILDDGNVLYESNAICEYIDEAYPVSLHPENLLDKAESRTLCDLASDYYMVQCSTQRSVDEKSLEQRRAEFVKVFAIIEKYLDDGPYFSGNSLSMVDIAWIPLLHRAELVKIFTGYDFLTDFPKASKWQAELMKTTELKNSVSNSFNEIFKAFYLNEERYLGRLYHDVKEQNFGT